jgi:ribosome maturation factor RimP
MTLKVSSPGVERVIRVPDELERFKERAMYVRYVAASEDLATPQEVDGVFRLISYDMDLCECTWGIADVKINRQQTGKGRPLSKKQREWRLQTRFESLKLVRVYSEC